MKQFFQVSFNSFGSENGQVLTLEYSESIQLDVQLKWSSISVQKLSSCNCPRQCVTEEYKELIETTHDIGEDNLNQLRLRVFFQVSIAVMTSIVSFSN